MYAGAPETNSFICTGFRDVDRDLLPYGMEFFSLSEIKGLFETIILDGLCDNVCKGDGFSGGINYYTIT